MLWKDHNRSKVKEGLGLNQVQNEEVTVKTGKMKITPGRRKRAQAQRWKSAKCTSDRVNDDMVWVRSFHTSDKTRKLGW